MNNNLYLTNLYSNYYFKGCVSGMCGILISHPIDSIKTHYIMNNKINISPHTLYRGLLSPLIGVGIEKAIVFGTYKYFSKHFNIPISGAIAGFSAALIVSPYERIKILKQTKQSINYSPSFLFRGLSATFTREIPGFAIYFSTYEGLKKHFYTDNNMKISISSSFIFGGISGSVAWIFIYPQDRIKTIIQTNTNNNIKEIIKTTYKLGGLKHFYSGFSFALIRAILLHSGTFCTMEILSK